MRHVIIFEGPDGCGKTEMGKELSRRINVPYFRMASQHENFRKGKFKEALEFDQTYIAEFLKQTRHSVIIDRAYPSEWVYSRAFKRETNDDVLRQVDDIFSSLGTTIIIPYRSDYSKNRYDEVIPAEKYRQIHDLYVEFSKWTKCESYFINVDKVNNDIDQEMDILVPLIKR